MTTMTRRQVLKVSGATAGLVLAAPSILRAQSKEPIPIGTLCPLTGAGGSYGPDMQRAVIAVGERINRVGGINGHARPSVGPHGHSSCGAPRVRTEMRMA